MTARCAVTSGDDLDHLFGDFFDLRIVADPFQSARRIDPCFSSALTFWPNCDSGTYKDQSNRFPTKFLRFLGEHEVVNSLAALGARSSWECSNKMRTMAPRWGYVFQRRAWAGVRKCVRRYSPSPARETAGDHPLHLVAADQAGDLLENCLTYRRRVAAQSSWPRADSSR